LGHAGEKKRERRKKEKEDEEDFFFARYRPFYPRDLRETGP